MKSPAANIPFSPNLFQRMSCSGKGQYLSLEDSIQEEIVQLLRHAARSGRLRVSIDGPVSLSVLNYGLPLASFGQSSVAEVDEVIRHLKRMLPEFEPRLAAGSLQITASVSEGRSFRESILFEINAQTRIPEHPHISFKVAVDFSNGGVHLVRRPSL